MITFVQHMTDYLHGVMGTEEGVICWIEVRQGKGFRKRLADYSDRVKEYEKTGSDVLLVELLREEFVLSGMVEDERIERMRENLLRAEKTRFAWVDEARKMERKVYRG